MRIADPPIPVERIREFTAAGTWVATTSADELEARAAETPDKIALVDRSSRLTYGDYQRRVRKLAAHFVALGLTADDVVAIQLPNWNEFAIAIGAAVLAGVPFCQFHADFRRRELEFMLRFTGAAALILPDRFRRFDYMDMLADLQPQLPALKHVMVVGDEVPRDRFDLRAFLAAPGDPEAEERLLRGRRPHPNALMRTAFTSGTTGDPKAVLHLHNTTNCAIRFLNRGQRIGPDSVFLVFLPAGLNWGLFNVLQALFAGARLVLQDVFRADEALDLIQRERVTHFCCAPAHLVAMLNVPDLEHYDLGSLESMMTGGASCPIEVIREVAARMPGHLLEMYGMLECGTQAHTTLDEDPEEVCGLVGRPVPEMGIRVVREDGADCAPDEAGEILTYGPGVTIGYYNNDDANARSFTADGWFHTGDLGVLDARGYLRIVGRKKEMIIRGGANIYPRELEEILYQHPKVLDAAIVGVPDPRLGERVCACLVPKPGQTLSGAEVLEFLRGKIATYKLPEYVEFVDELPRTPTGKVQKTPLSQAMVERIGEAGAR
ncbi:MAG: AMP-binding protein [Alphaproteobacteria bacterium]|nr:AMP-binding protein [Alphaproteobacteria bacterium]